MMPKIKITRAGGYDPELGPKHPANQDPTLKGHVIEIETNNIPAGDGHYDTLHRWRCSCGAPPGDWKTRAFQARQGGTKHVAHAERKR